MLNKTRKHISRASQGSLSLAVVTALGTSASLTQDTKPRLGSPKSTLVPQGTSAVHPTFIDLFCGAGGLALGFKMAGYRSVWAVDNDAASAATYKRNFGHEVFCGDIRTLRGPFPEADVLIGGPPCQGFSPLGQMSGSQTHSELNELWREYVRVLRSVRPRVFVVENVPEFLKSEQCAQFLLMAKKLGYSTATGVLNAYDFGVPQRRRRGFILGSNVGTPKLPSPSNKRKTVRDAIGDLPLKPTEINWHLGRNPNPESVERYKCVPAGGNRFDLVRRRPDLAPKCWLRKKSGSTDVFGRLEWDKPSLTIRTEFFKPEKGCYLHPVAHRPITHREAARLQTFPDDFLLVGSKTEAARMIGNAVPPLLSQAIAESLQPLVLEGIRTTRHAESKKGNRRPHG